MADDQTGQRIFKYCAGCLVLKSRDDHVVSEMDPSWEKRVGAVATTTTKCRNHALGALQHGSTGMKQYARALEQ